MPWSVAGDGLWKFDGSADRHLLLKEGTRYVELHDRTVHVYDGPVAVSDETYPLGGPDVDTPVVTWASSEIREDLADAGDAAAWAALREGRYTDSTAARP